MRLNPILNISGVAVAALAITSALAQPADEVVALERFEVTTTLDSYRTADADATLKQGTPLRVTPFSVAVANAAIAAAGDRLAGLVTEAPTNPLVQTADLPAVSARIHAAQGRLIIDPSLVSAHNVDVLPHADLVVTSLTKYASAEGDTIAGVSVINPDGPDADWLRTRVARYTDPIYRRDLQRLAAQIGDYASIVAQTNANTAAVVDFLRQHPGVKNLFWSLRPASRDNYLKIARDADHIGSIISFTVHGELAAFYDRLTLAKGPSFGMRTTLICPFIYLAHYDLVTSENGRAQLAAAGIDPELLRLSVGTEPIADILAALDAALPR
jgi:cystathionine gamma-synthase